MPQLDALQNILGVAFEDVTHLQQSLVHRSYLNESEALSETSDDHPLSSNERLEFLGDALLGHVVAERLYCEFPDFSEGDLTKVRSALVRTETLARIARSLNLGDYLFLGKGEAESGGRRRQRNLACALEAVIGAILVDQGFNVAREFVLRILGKELERATAEKLEKDPKSRLQEVVQAEQRLTPVYRTDNVTGPDHDRIFVVDVFAGKTFLGRGSGKSKRAAEQEAAVAALKTLEGESDLV
ncbi:ribonuclease III [Dehalococcoidia bacterium]|nr:ribonuclease III [Dehalococcoidia bacterium]MCL0092569.1 ribonuclease III [Dehalococcoidia bacterium]MCL0099136.1 ribonuclease III [Dehalococcoidia bacterium]